MNVGRTGARDAVCRARAGPARAARPCRWRRCTTSRKSRAATSAKATSCVIEKGGDIIPKVVGPVLESAPSGSAEPWQMPTDVPVLPERAREAGGRSRVAVRERVLPGADPPRPAALRVPPRDEHRRPGRVAGRSAGHAGTGPRLRRPLRADGRPAGGARSDGQEVGREPGGRDRQEPAAPSSGGCCTASASVTSARAARARWPRRFGRCRDCARRRSSSCRRSPMSARSSRESVRAFLDEPANAALIDRLAAAGVRMEDEATRRRGAGRAAAGRADVSSITGTLDGDEPRGGDRSARAARRARSRRRSAKKTTGLIVGRDARQQARQGAGARACRSSMRPRFWPL